METDDLKTFDESVIPKKNNNRTIVGLVAILLVIMCCCLVALSVVLVDPFDWRLLGFLSGGGDSVVEAMPVDTNLYIGLDMDQLTPVELGRLIDPFLAEDISFDYREFGELLIDLDNELESSAGFNLSDDVLPWLGPNVGIGFVDYVFDQYGSVDELQILAVAETKDGAASDAFIVKFRAGVEENTGTTFIQTEYEGVTIYELESDNEDEKVSIASSGDLVYLATGAGAIEAGIDAQKGESLADNEEYSKLEPKMSSDRAITLFFSSEFVADAGGGLGTGLPIDPQDVPLIGASGGALTLSIIERGLQVDFLTSVDSDSLSDGEKLLLEGSEAKTAEMFPEDTIVYFTAGSIGQFWDALVATSPDYAEAMDELQDEIGFDLINDLVVYLDGETGLGLWPSTSGVLADATGITLAFAALAGTSDEAAVYTASGNIAGFLEDQFMTVDSKSSDGLTIYSVSEEFSGIEAAYGVGSGYFFIASGERAVADIFAGESSLADSARYKNVWSAFPSGTAPVLYIDAEGLSVAINDAAAVMGDSANDAVSVLGPVTYIALGTDFDVDVMRATMILFLESK